MIIAAKMLLAAMALLFYLPLYAGENQPASETENIKFQLENYSKANQEREREELRQEWKNLLGVDIFYPYYQAREIESWISDRVKVEVFHLSGRPEFENNQATYTFRVEF